MRWVAAFLFVFLQSGVAEVLFQSSFAEASSEGIEPHWINPNRVEKSDPVFAGSDFSGISGNWFALLSNTFVDLPTEVGSTYRLSFQYSATDSFSDQQPLEIEIAAEIFAYLGSHEETHHEIVVTVEDVNLITSTKRFLATPGTHNWRMREWRSAQLIFVAQTNVTRVKFSKTSFAGAASCGAIDDVKVERVFPLPLKNVNSALVLKYQRELTRLQTRLVKAKRADRLPKVINELKRKIHKTRALLKKAQGE